MAYIRQRISDLEIMEAQEQQKFEELECSKDTGTYIVEDSHEKLLETYRKEIENSRDVIITIEEKVKSLRRDKERRRREIEEKRKANIQRRMQEQEQKEKERWRAEMQRKYRYKKA